MSTVLQKEKENNSKTK